MTRVVSARWVFPIGTPPIGEGAIALDDDGTIQAVGPRAEVMARAPGAVEERVDGALLPGLVNAHTHLELSALAGRVAGGDGLVPWAMAVAREAAGAVSDQRAAAATRAARAAVAAGTAAVGDVANTLTAVPALAEAGLSGVVFHELLGSRDARTGDALADAARERKVFLCERSWPEGVAYVPAPHAPYSADPALLRRVFAAAAASGQATSIHVAEDPDELSLLRDGGGRWAAILEAMKVPAGARTPRLGPVAYLASLDAFAGRPPLLVHMVHATDEDIALAREHRAPVVLCPRSNLHIGGRLPDVPAFVQAGLRLAIGTDSLASTPDLSLWGEIATLAARFPDVSPEIWLHAATSGGAAALGLDALGALAPGRRPGVLAVDLVDGADASHAARSLTHDPSPRVRWIDRP